MSEAREKSGLGQGNFFAIDRRIWAKLCVPGRINEAVAYLLLARGTGRDNRTTTWSVESIERYTRISRGRAKTALLKLQAEAHVRLLRGGTKPKYDLVPHHDPKPCREPLSAIEQRVVDQVANGSEVSTTREKQAGHRAVRKGWLTSAADGRFAIRPEPKAATDLIWLPNELVTAAAGETPPVELVRQTQDPMTLRLLVDLYHAQNLRENGGVARTLIWRAYERVRVGERGQFMVWGFHNPTEWVHWEEGLTMPHRREDLSDAEKAAGKNQALDLFRRLRQLTDLGLIEWIPHLIESAGDSGEIIHPIGDGGSDSIEDRLGLAADQAARALITEGQCDWAVENDIEPLVPVPRHLANVQLIGIARLRYRPHTRMTAAWWADMNADAEKHLARYTDVVRQHTPAVV